MRINQLYTQISIYQSIVLKLLMMRTDKTAMSNSLKSRYLIIFFVVIFLAILPTICLGVNYPSCDDWLVRPPQRGSEIQGEFIEGWHGVRIDNLMSSGKDTVEEIVRAKKLIAYEGGNVYGRGVYFYSKRPPEPNSYHFAAWIHFRIPKKKFLEKGWSALVSTPNNHVSPERLVPMSSNYEMNIEVMGVYWNEAALNKQRKIIESMGRTYSPPPSYKTIGAPAEKNWAPEIDAQYGLQ